MARVTYGAPVTDLAGSIAGTTFQKNSSGAIARSRPYTPVNPSAAQSANQQNVTRLTALWTSMDYYQKYLWGLIAYGRTFTDAYGVEKVLSKYQWFMSCNLNLIAAGLAQCTNPPYYEAPDAAPDFTLAMDDTKLDIEFATPFTSGANPLLIYASPPLRTVSAGLRKTNFLLSADTYIAVSVIEMKDLYEAAFNVSVADLYDSAKCFIIFRLKNVHAVMGFASPYNYQSLELPI